ncbi:thiol:disulfide interchange protein DsbA/DsbL [Legionella spiritensis]|uniref:Thiol:disulfide interchange protein n=1 Tax=Legionella spiritensis TaxID=452 RepID=A0A0W0YZA9_LEGSP|nr:thiol:disulfide interchange protein DsbA/DsbL [Legionella spiritensis]KTD62233.1 thiol:disulfide interchange protein DsbA [Legionella spiritensis]SNV29065.1 thiol:disulfide interchange protein DsbA [Legionella spiritensis]
MLRNFLLVIALLLPFHLFAEDFVAGKDYEVLKGEHSATIQPPVKVTEFFSYGCPWCYRIESGLQGWVKQQNGQISFTRVPVVFNNDWSYYAKAYYTAALLGLDNKLNPLLFKAVQDKQAHLNNTDAMITFFTEHGVDNATAQSAFKNSTTIDMQLNQGGVLMARFHVNAVPAIVVNDQYKTDLQMAQDEQRLFKILDYLVRLSRQKHG